ncbi:MAG: electron transport complex subunit RsxG [Gammaproteobacteria bacterium]|nr:MAG: electron transport complex subunit RsxG [Gammaproteobacteria bacterium]
MDKAINTAALLLAGFAVLGTGLVALTREATAERIAEQQRRALLRGLNEIIPSSRYDNDLATDTTTAADGEHLIYRARHNGQPVAAVISTAAEDSYSGTPIELLVGINTDGSLAGVRVVSHKETPGLGDGIMLDRSPWILSFNGRSLEQTPEARWQVKKDGGDFDQFTGATITPRAVIHAVHNTLKYHQQNRHSIYASAAGREPPKANRHD